jgi:hypothetical protein
MYIPVVFLQVRVEKLAGSCDLMITDRYRRDEYAHTVAMCFFIPSVQVASEGAWTWEDGEATLVPEL